MKLISLTAIAASLAACASMAPEPMPAPLHPAVVYAPVTPPTPKRETFPYPSAELLNAHMICDLNKTKRGSYPTGFENCGTVEKAWADNAAAQGAYTKRSQQEMLQRDMETIQKFGSQQQTKKTLSSCYCVRPSMPAMAAAKPKP